MNNICILQKSSYGTSLVDLDSYLSDNRKIFICGEITSDAAVLFMKQIMALTSAVPDDPIDVFVNSNGGDINAGMMMYDILQSSKTPIRMWCVGKAYSMGAVLVACGKDGRYILPHSEMMIHEPALGNRIGGNTTSIKSVADSLLKEREKINAVLAKHTGKSLHEIEEATSFDHFFSAEESVEFGLCDEIREGLPGLGF